MIVRDGDDAASPESSQCAIQFGAWQHPRFRLHHGIGDGINHHALPTLEGKKGEGHIIHMFRREDQRHRIMSG